MEENNILEKLCLFGLTRQEATIYLCLYHYGELTGYEVAKHTGISRSNVYSGLSGLSDKGAAYLAEGNTSKYVPVPIEEFCENKIRCMQSEKDFLNNHIPAMKQIQIGYITIEGYRNIFDKIVNMLRSAEKRIYLSASGEMIALLKDELEEVAKKDIKLVLLSDAIPESETVKNACIFYMCGDRGKNVRLIIDSQYALTGALNGTKDDTCLYTGQDNFIQVFKDALRNEMQLISMQGGNGGFHE
ncbi:MAG: TrmB family transcriptional regulator [Lachnospiraceae bacterium]|nr:TrmB family transcriptional regulator [Lachnospiraceae bacterium]